MKQYEVSCPYCNSKIKLFEGYSKCVYCHNEVELGVTMIDVTTGEDFINGTFPKYIEWYDAYKVIRGNCGKPFRLFD